MMQINFFKPVVNLNAPIHANTHVIRFGRDTHLTGCHPGSTPPPNPPFPTQLPEGPWDEWFDGSNIDWTIFQNNLPPQLPEAKKSIWGGSPCVWPQPHTFRQGDKYYAELTSSMNGHYNPNALGIWKININGIRYEVSQYNGDVIDLGSASALKSQMNLLYIALALVVVGLTYRFFVKK